SHDERGNEHYSSCEHGENRGPTATGKENEGKDQPNERDKKHWNLGHELLRKEREAGVLHTFLQSWRLQGGCVEGGWIVKYIWPWVLGLRSLTFPKNYPKANDHLIHNSSTNPCLILNYQLAAQRSHGEVRNSGRSKVTSCYLPVEDRQ